MADDNFDLCMVLNTPSVAAAISVTERPEWFSSEPSMENCAAVIPKTLNLRSARRVIARAAMRVFVGEHGSWNSPEADRPLAAPSQTLFSSVSNRAEFAGR
jgi:hypothetical protein